MANEDLEYVDLELNDVAFLEKILKNDFRGKQRLCGRQLEIPASYINKIKMKSERPGESKVKGGPVLFAAIKKYCEKVGRNYKEFVIHRASCR